MLIDFYHVICGYAEVELWLGTFERLANTCAKNGIFIWNVKKTGGVYRFCISSDSAKRISDIAKSNGCGIKIIRYRGLKYNLSRLKKRYALMVGAAIFAALVFTACSVVWRIEIEGCVNSEHSDIINILESNGVKKWCFKRNVDTEELSKNIVSGVRGVAWANTEMKGTVLKVEIRERREIPFMVDNEAYDLVAARDGVITEMRVRNGEKLKKVGEKVEKGEIIVSALVEKDGENLLPNPYTVHSFGEVIASTWYEFDVVQPLYREKNSYSGAKMSKKRIKILKFPINLYFRGSILYAEYDKIVKSKGSHVKYENEIVFEKKTERQKLTVDEAVDEAVYAASKKLPSRIMSAKCVGSDYTFGDGCLNVHVIFECTENIAVEQRYTERREDINDSYNK